MMFIFFLGMQKFGDQTLSEKGQCNPALSESCSESMFWLGSIP